MKLLRQGAEAKLFLGKFKGEKALFKERVPKPYRGEALDEAIRKQRTKAEAKLLGEARSVGVETPKVFDVNDARKSIAMEFVEGKRLKDELNGKNLGLCSEVGRLVAKLHKNNLIHGDLTTSNILVRGKGLVFIDFGLGFRSKRAEDKAVDLLVFKKTFNATHSALGNGWELIEKGYLAENPEGKDVLARLAEVEARVRYH